METRKEIIKQMGDAMREDIFLEVNNRIAAKFGTFTFKALSLS